MSKQNIRPIRVRRIAVSCLIGAALLFMFAETANYANNDASHSFEPITQPDFRLPLPSGKDWGLSVEAGTPTSKCNSGLGGKFFKGGFDCLHSKQGKYSLDFVPFTRQDNGQLVDVHVLAAADGTIETTMNGKDQCYGEGCPASYGNYVTINHGNGYTTFYGHLKKDSIPAIVHSGQPVKRGDQLGLMGTSGYSSGVHLHFETRYHNEGTNETTILDQVLVDGRRIIDYTVSNPLNYYRSTNDPTATTATQFNGFHDGSDCTHIFGWALDKSQVGQRVSVEIFDGNTSLGTAVANEFRPDLRNPSIGDGSGTYAFNFAIPSQLKDGNTHIVKVKVAGTDFFLSNTLQPFTSVCNPNPIATFTITGGTTSVGKNGLLTIPVPPGSTAQVNFNGTATIPGASGGVNFAWLLQPTFPPQAPQSNAPLTSPTPIQNPYPAFDASLSPGTYDVHLTTTNSAHLTDSATATVVVNSTSVSAPFIGSIAPDSVAPGVFDITINGGNFDPNATDQIFFGNTFVGNGSILSRTPTQIVVREAMSAATMGIYTVKVRNSDGQLSNGKPLTLTRTQNPAPAIVSINPSSVTPSVFDLTINGTNFDNGSIEQLFFGSSLVGSGTILSRTATQIRARESMTTATPGTYTVKVRNSDGQLSNGVGLALTQAQTLPTISNMTTSPNPPVSGQAFNFTITGTNYDTSNAEVFFLGPGCPTSSACVVSGLTRNATQLTGAAVLAAGAFTAQVRNGSDGTPSNTWSLSVSTGTPNPAIDEG